MNQHTKRFLYVTVLALVVASPLALSFFKKEPPGYSTSPTSKVLTSSDKTTPTTTEQRETSRSHKEISSTATPNKQEETTEAIRQEEQTEELTKPNPPMPQEVIDRLHREYNQMGSIHRLDISQQIQKNWNTCAPTTVSMMLSSQGIQIGQEQLATEMGTDTVFGTHNANAIAILNRHLFGYDQPSGNQAGYRLATVTTDAPYSEQMRLFKERLKKNIADGYPMYYTFDNALIYPGRGSGEHNVIGTGYQLTADGSDIAFLYYIDPSYSQQDAVYGGLKKMTPNELFTAMLTCVEPQYAW